MGLLKKQVETCCQMLLFLGSYFCSPVTTAVADQDLTKFYQLEAKSLQGQTFSFSSLRGKVVLIVNTASKCGYTSQYKGLQELYEKYHEKGFVILGFPSNDFGGQEPGTNKDIESFCKLNYGVAFPVMEIAPVTKDMTQPVYKYLLSQ